MAVIEKPIKLRGSKGEQAIVAIFDSASTYSCIQPELGIVSGLTTKEEIEKTKKILTE